jgi:hypothetical protein
MCLTFNGCLLIVSPKGCWDDLRWNHGSHSLPETDSTRRLPASLVTSDSIPSKPKNTCCLVSFARLPCTSLSHSHLRGLPQQSFLPAISCHMVFVSCTSSILRISASLCFPPKQIQSIVSQPVSSRLVRESTNTSNTRSKRASVNMKQASSLHRSLNTTQLKPSNPAVVLFASTNSLAADEMS